MLVDVIWEETSEMIPDESLQFKFEAMIPNFDSNSESVLQNLTLSRNHGYKLKLKQYRGDLCEDFFLVQYLKTVKLSPGGCR